MVLAFYVCTWFVCQLVYSIQFVHVLWEDTATEVWLGEINNEQH